MKRRAALVLASSVLVLASAARSSAQPAEGAYEPPELLATPPTLPATLAPGSRPLSIRDAVRLAVKENLGVVLSRKAVDSAEAFEDAARGQYEPLFRGAYTRFSSVSPPATLQEGAPGQSLEFRSDSWSAGVSYPLQTGTTLSIDWANNRSFSERGTAVEPLLYRSGLDVRVTQSLLRGFSFDLDVPQADILRAELATEEAAAQLRAQMLDTVQRTEDAYWELVFAIKSYDVQQASLVLAENQLDLTRRQIDAGLLAPASLIEAEGTLAQRQLNLVEAEAAIAAASDALRLVLAVTPGTWTAPIQPTDLPDFAALEIPEDEAMLQARQSRPELRARQLAAQRSDLSRRLADNARLPQLDLFVGYGLVGQDDSYGDTNTQLFSNDSRSWSVGVNLSWAPLGREARARIRAAEIDADMARIQLEQSELDVYREVRLAVRELQTAARQLRAAARFRNLSAQSLDVEERKFVAGTSSNFLVTQRQDALRQAQQSELAALVRHKRAATAMLRTMGTLLDSRNIEVVSR